MLFQKASASSFCWGGDSRMFFLVSSRSTRPREDSGTWDDTNVSSHDFSFRNHEKHCNENKSLVSLSSSTVPFQADGCRCRCRCRCRFLCVERGFKKNCTYHEFFLFLQIPIVIVLFDVLAPPGLQLFREFLLQRRGGIVVGCRRCLGRFFSAVVRRIPSFQRSKKRIQIVFGPAACFVARAIDFGIGRRLEVRCHDRFREERMASHDDTEGNRPQQRFERAKSSVSANDTKDDGLANDIDLVANPVGRANQTQKPEQHRTPAAPGTELTLFPDPSTPANCLRAEPAMFLRTVRGRVWQSSDRGTPRLRRSNGCRERPAAVWSS